MAREPIDETLSSQELDKALEADGAVEDELLASAAVLPIVEPQPSQAPPSETRGLVRALWFFGAIVTAMLVLQTFELFLARSLPEEVAAGGASGARPAPVVPPPAPAEEVDRTLREMRLRLSRSLYEDVARTLEPLAEDPALLDKDQRFEANLLLARAHRQLGNVEKAQLYSLRATDQMIERREPAQVLEYASGLAEQGRHPEARAELMKLLARRDAMTARDQAWLTLAHARIADAWYLQARRSGQLPPLPGAPQAVER